MSRISDEQMAARVEEYVLMRIESPDIRLELPVLPTMAARCLELLSDPDFSVNELARIIGNDPIMAARIVHLANSAGRATLEPARSVLQSVMRLGGDELRSFMIEVAALPLFESYDPTITIFGRALWTHSVAVALLARAVVRKVGRGQPEAAYLAGLLHDVGKPVVAAMLLDAERRLFNIRTRTWLFPLTWLSLIEKAHRRVGMALADSWRLPDLVVRSVRDADNYDTTDPENPANAVRFANALAKLAGVYVGTVDRGDIDSLVFVGRRMFALSDDDLAALIDGLKERVDERLA